MPPSHTCARTALSTYAVSWDYVGRHGADDFLLVIPTNCPVDSLWRYNLPHNAVNARQNSLKMEPFGTAFNLAKINITKTSSLRHRDKRSWFCNINYFVRPIS